MSHPLLRWRSAVSTMRELRRAVDAQRPGGSEDNPDPVASLTRALAEAEEPTEVADILVRRVTAATQVDLVALAAVSEDGKEARGLLALQGGSQLAWYPSMQLDLEGESSGIRSAVSELSPVVVYDVQGSSTASRRPADALDARSAAYVPLLSGGRVVAVLVAASTKALRAFSNEEVSLLSDLAGAAAIPLRRALASAELRQALATEQRRARIERRLRAELEVEQALTVAAEETGRALEADRALAHLLEGPAGTASARWPGGEREGPGTEPDALLEALERAQRERRRIEIDAGDPSGPSLVAVPIVAGEGALGALAVERSGASWQPSDVALLEAVAGELGIAARSAALRSENGRRLRQQRAFDRIASELGRSLSLPSTLDALGEAATDALGGAAAAVLMPERDGLVLAASHLLPEAVARSLEPRRIDAGLRRASEEGHLLASASLASDDRFRVEWRELLRDSGYGALLAAPMAAPRARACGLVLVFFAGERRFEDDDIELARHLADAARGALERSDLFEAERASRRLAQQLARTGSLLATELDPEAVLHEVVEHAPSLVGADACTIQALEGDELVVTAASGAEAAGAIGVRAPSTAWLSGDVAQTLRPVVVEDIQRDRVLVPGDPLLGRGYDAYLGVPLIGPEGAPSGVLAVYARGARTWREHEIEGLQALASGVSSALSNAELYQSVAFEKERSVAILANVADGIVAVDREGRVVLWNDAAERITGVPSSEAIGRTTLQVLQRSLEWEGGTQAGDRLVSISRGGDEVWLSLTEAVMEDASGAPAGRVFAFRDISSERLVEQMKSDFVSTVSQRLRAPLTSIYGFAETLLRDDVLFGEAERQTFVRYISSESERLMAIVDALLNVASVDAGDLQVTLAPTDVGSVVEDVAAAIAGDEESPDHRFVVDIPEEPLTATADPEKLRQILAILLDNAVRFSPDGGTVTLGARRSGDVAQVSVDDEGVGIPQADRERIFRKFYRGDAAAREGGPAGIGLGLFLANGLVQAMGGRMRVDSVEGDGSTFTVELPLARQPAVSVGERL